MLLTHEAPGAAATLTFGAAGTQTTVTGSATGVLPVTGGTIVPIAAPAVAAVLAGLLVAALERRRTERRR